MRLLFSPRLFLRCEIYRINYIKRVMKKIKKKWHFFKDLEGKDKCSATSISHNGRIYTRQCKIANIFNSTYIAIVDQISSSFDSSTKMALYILKLLVTQTQPKFEFCETTYEKVYEKIDLCKCTKSHGLDKVSNLIF